MKRRIAVASGILVIAAAVVAGCTFSSASTARAPVIASQPLPGVATPAPVSVPTRNSAGYFVWTVQDLKAALEKKDFVLVNVHTPFEGRIEGTDLEIPHDAITKPEFLAQLPADKNARIVLYCRTGGMSNTAVNALVKLGYTNLVDVKGGMRAWEAAGNELDKESPAMPESSCD